MRARQQTKATLGYRRVPTEGQATKGVSMETREAKIRAWAVANYHRILKEAA